jgi:hypothetical protein
MQIFPRVGRRIHVLINYNNQEHAMMPAMLCVENIAAEGRLAKLETRSAIACFHNAPVSISVTDPGFRKSAATLQIAQLYKDLLLRAEKYVFIETQYLTSRNLMEVLCEVVSRSAPPDIFIILPERLGPWLEKKTMTHIQAITERTMRCEK